MFPSLFVLVSSVIGSGGPSSVRSSGLSRDSGILREGNNEETGERGAKVEEIKYNKRNNKINCRNIKAMCFLWKWTCRKRSRRWSPLMLLCHPKVPKFGVGSVRLVAGKPASRLAEQTQSKHLPSTGQRGPQKKNAGRKTDSIPSI